MGFLKEINQSSPKAPLLLITTTFDDISTVGNGDALINLLNTKATGPHYHRENIILPGILHGYQVRSLRVIETAVDFLDNNQPTSVTKSDNFRAILVLYYMAITTILLTPFILVLLSPKSSYKRKRTLQPGSPLTSHQIKSLIRFNGFLWLPSLFIGTILPLVMFVSPLGKPFFSIDFLVFYGGFGVLSYFLFRMKKLIPLDKNILEQFKVIKPSFSLYPVLLSLFFFVGIIAIKVSGYAMIMPRLSTFFWFIIFAFLLYLSFSVIFFYNDLIMASKPSFKQRVSWLLKKFLPFLLLSLVFLSLGSYLEL